MVTAKEIIDMYVSFFEKKGHKRIPNAPLIPQNDPTTLFTSSGMQPLVPYLLGEEHQSGKRLVNVQNSFRAQDIDEIGDNRHTTFFRMLGNWSLGDYFKEEQISWMWEFVTKILKIPKGKLYVTVFEGDKDIPRDQDSAKIWQRIFVEENLDPKERIFYYGEDKNWWSRSGPPQKMPPGEPGGPDTEIFFDSGTPHDEKFGEECHVNCDCGRFLEICNSVFMQYKKTDISFDDLPRKNVDFGGGLERFLAAAQNQQDIFQTSLFKPIIQSIERATEKNYKEHQKPMRIIADHFVASTFIAANKVTPSNKGQGYILRRLIRRGLDHYRLLGGKDPIPVLETIVEKYKDTDPTLVDQYEKIKYKIILEENLYRKTLDIAQQFITKKYQRKTGDELKGAIIEISTDDAFLIYTTHGLSPTQIKSLGYTFNEKDFAEKMKAHQALSRKGAERKFAGGLADHSEKTIMGHTATHLLHQALRDVLGKHVHQTGSNITTERLRFDFNFERKLTSEEIKRVEAIVNEKIVENLPVHFEMMSLSEAKKIGAIGLFNEKYQDSVKIYFVGDYSKEFCGGPHVDFTGKIKSFKIIKQESIGKGQQRIYAIAG